MSDLSALRKQYGQYKERKLSLNMQRGQPSDDDLNLSLSLIDILDREDFVTPSGIDIRNYPGGIQGLPEACETFSELLGVQPDEMVVGNNSSLEMMTGILQWALLKGVKGSPSPWVANSPKMIVTVPGYDRHFQLLEILGFELVTVKMTGEGPDIDAIEKLARNDPQIKGIFFVPTYSNPTGDTISADVARQLVTLDAAAPDFTIFADDAYAVHHLDEDLRKIPHMLSIAKEMGRPERVILFGSTSKVTFASGGLGLMAMSQSNLDYWLGLLKLQSIGPNKVEQWRHVRFLEKYPGGLKGLMRDHAAIIKPKFEAIFRILEEEFKGTGLATWTQPKGGYFINFDTAKPVAAQVVQLAAEIGVSLTPAGATFPGGKDPENRNIRIAPTRPPLHEIEEAALVMATCVKLASAEYDV
ncbi:MAG: aminotransferase class I/II-fold pyridoxal phosphate-dependent enzyme [Chloroflexota bacterium]